MTAVETEVGNRNIGAMALVDIVYPSFIIFTSYPVTLLNSCVHIVLTMNTSVLIIDR